MCSPLPRRCGETICGQPKQVRQNKTRRGGSKSAVYFPMSRRNTGWRWTQQQRAATGDSNSGRCPVGWLGIGVRTELLSFFFLSPSLSLPLSLSLRLSLSVPIKLLVVLTHHSPPPPSLSSLSLLPFPHLLAQTRGQLWTESRPAVCLCVCVRVHVWEIICGSRECSLQVRLDSNTKDMLYNGCAEFKFWVATFVVSLKSDRPPRRHSYYKMLKKGLTSWEII